jgi:hypothetical protein
LEARAVLAYGQDFLTTGRKAGSLLVRAYLVGHGLELLFKSYLLHSGLRPTQLKHIGHKLTKLLAECTKHGLASIVTISPQLVSDVTLFDAVYAAKRLEYFSLLDMLSPPRIPDLARTQQFAAKLSKALDKALPHP